MQSATTTYQTATGINVAEGVKASPRIDSLCDPHAHPEMQPNPSHVKVPGIKDKIRWS